MRANNKTCQKLIDFRIDGIFNDTENVKAGKNGFGELNVLGERDGGVIATANGIRCCDDGTACLEGGNDAGFGNGNGLLFHCFVDGSSVLIIHFIEFVNETSSFVGEHKRTSLKSPFGCDGVFVHACGKTNSRSTLSGSKDSSMGCFLDVLQDLRFRGTGITKEEDVDVPPDGMFSVNILGDTAEKRKGHCCFDIFVAVDTGCNGVHNLLLAGVWNGIYSLGDVRIFTEGFNFAFVVFA